jgi:hypothetical protein
MTINFKNLEAISSAGLPERVSVFVPDCKPLEMASICLRFSK